MKYKNISQKDTIKISKSAPPVEVFDRASVEDIGKQIVYSKYQTIFGEHKDKILDLVISRIALDSVLTSVQSKLAELNNGSPIDLVNKETNDKISGIFDEALLIYAFDAALSKVLDSDETRKDFLLRYTEKRPGMVTTPKATGGPLGSAISKNPEAMKSTIDMVEKILREKEGERDNAPSPYGHVEKDKSGRLPVAGVMGRKRKTTKGRS